jgi:leader peptidase (prepilin peptidase)/N-methyltransferase
LNLSIITPRSFCPNCKNTIPLYRNIPLITYILQFGKCNYCNKRISPIYPIIELLVGFIWLFSSFYFLNIHDILEFSIIASILVAIATIDYKHYVIPIELSMMAFIIITIFLCISSSFISHLSGLILGISYLSIILIVTWFITKRQGLGFGDIQLILVLGYWLGDFRVLIVIFLAAILALLSWIILSLINGFNKERALPFGTYLSLASILIYPIEFSFLNFL